MTYEHRNGERKIPLVPGAYWGQGPDERMVMLNIGYNTRPGDPQTFDTWYANYMGDQWDMASSDFEVWRFWGPVPGPDATHE